MKQTNSIGMCFVGELLPMMLKENVDYMAIFKNTIKKTESTDFQEGETRF